MGKKIFINEDNENKIEGKVYKVADDRVGAAVNVTHNLGDYNSLSVRFSWESDFQDGEDFDSASERVYRSVEKKVEDALKEYLEEE